MAQLKQLSEPLLAWFEVHGRHELPWQQRATPYRVWVSEIMLQQTQVETVIPYYRRFMQRFPHCGALAAATVDEVLHLWTGLGYYARARNLHRAAQQIQQQHHGEVPTTFADLLALPGIGRSSAGAILALSCGQRHAILDGNAKRVLARYHAIEGWPGSTSIARKLWALAEHHLPHTCVANYTQAIMDLGAKICTRTRPRCEACPLAAHCRAHLAGRSSCYPASKPQRKLPLRETVFLICRQASGVLLLKRRPPSGVWGGLWCFPEVGDDALVTIDHWCDQHGVVRTSAAQHYQEMTHAFTHFRLRIRTQLFAVTGHKDRVMAPEQWLWYKIADPAHIGLPRPVEKLIGELAGLSQEQLP